VWSSFDGSGICPIGYRVPIIDELIAERNSLSISSGADAYNSILKLPTAGNRSATDGRISADIGYYWSANILEVNANPSASTLFINAQRSAISASENASGSSVRCILNVGENPIPPSIEALTIGNQNFSIAENSAIGTTISIVSTTGNPTEFSIIRGNDRTAFAISNSGQLTAANGALDFETKKIYTLTVKISKNGTASKIAQIIINVTDVDDILTFNGLKYSPVRSVSNRIWMDRNLGASRVSTSLTDVESYGYLYQWGRENDGHQFRDSATTTTKVDSIITATAKFIIDNDDWTTADSSGDLRADVWSIFDGNGICPVGYRVPTEAELEAERG
ncbi:MAG: hypothetical protein FXV79_06110, partial [Candidatus Thioglobus sp.]